MMKKGFTLVELLIVIVIIAILMAITFRLGKISDNQDQRQTTVLRLHALESAIGGYYAAFGSYPPVRLHGSRDIFCQVNTLGVQVVDEEPAKSINLNSDEGKIMVHAACRSQPLGMNYPFRRYAKVKDEATGKEIVEDVWVAINCLAQNLKSLAAAEGNVLGISTLGATGFDALQTPAQLDDWKNEAEWTHLNLFRFGLMSFLLPRFIMMMQGPDTGIYDKFDQWGDNNNVPCQLKNGLPYLKWEDMAKEVIPTDKGEINPKTWKVALLPSQIVTARWVACLEECCTYTHELSGWKKVWGVSLEAKGPSGKGKPTYVLSESGVTAQLNFPWRFPPVFSSGNLQTVDAAPTQPFALDGVTVVDGWGEEFYYYSPPPYQGYRLWSSGQDHQTFPPWVSEKDIDKLGANNAKIARQWRLDDVVHMSN